MTGRIKAAWLLRKAGKLYSRGEFEAAAAAVETARAAHPGMTDYCQYAGVIALKRGLVDEAERLLLDAEKSGFDPFVVQQALGAVDMARGRFAGALDRFRAALAAFPVGYEAGYHVGLAKLAAGDAAAARSEFTALLCRDDEALFKRIMAL